MASGGGSFLICHAETTVDTFNRKMFSVSLVGDDAALRCNRTSVSPQLRKMIIICLFFCLVSEKCAAVCPLKRRKKAAETETVNIDVIFITCDSLGGGGHLNVTMRMHCEL